MSNDALFIVIEGLDGSGKTTASKHLADYLTTTLHKKVKHTFEPNDHSCGGDFIRQTLRKEINDVSPQTLMMAFAANRLDHCDRIINPWLQADDHIVLCDRYYLSSLVYQTTNELSMEYVMELNSFARKPDLIFFLDVDDETCYQRMDVRNKPKELFEVNLAATRTKYAKAIKYLRRSHDENIVELDASGTIEEVVNAMLNILFNFYPEWKNQNDFALKPFKL